MASTVLMRMLFETCHLSRKGCVTSSPAVMVTSICGSPALGEDVRDGFADTRRVNYQLRRPVFSFALEDTIGATQRRTCEEVAHMRNDTRVRRTKRQPF